MTIKLVSSSISSTRSASFIGAHMNALPGRGKFLVRKPSRVRRPRLSPLRLAPDHFSGQFNHFIIMYNIFCGWSLTFNRYGHPFNFYHCSTAISGTFRCSLAIRTAYHSPSTMKSESLSLINLKAANNPMCDTRPALRPGAGSLATFAPPLHRRNKV